MISIETLINSLRVSIAINSHLISLNNQILIASRNDIQNQFDSLTRYLNQPEE